jgi:hypothetical protein
LWKIKETIEEIKTGQIDPNCDVEPLE